MYDSHEYFIDRTRQEISRSERYCLFLSLVMVDLNDCVRAISNRGSENRINHSDVYNHIEGGLRQSLRTSDIVSAFERNRMGVLLMETSKSGLETVQKRIESFIRDYLKGELQLPFEPQVNIRTASYPEESDKLSDLASQLGRVHQMVK